MFYAIIISISITSANSQKIIPLKLSNNKDTVLRHTLLIMKELGFEIRKNLYRDAGRPLSTDIIRNMNDARERASLIRYDSIYGKKNDPSARFYFGPQICFRKIIYDIIYHKYDTTKVYRLYAFSCFYHEMCHYLQSTIGRFPSDEEIRIAGNEVACIESPMELEAYSVEAYFFLYFYDRKKLNAILSEKEDRIRKIKKLINAFNDYRYSPKPNRNRLSL